MSANSSTSKRTLSSSQITGLLKKSLQSKVNDLKSKRSKREKFGFGSSATRLSNKPVEKEEYANDAQRLFDSMSVAPKFSRGAHKLLIKKSLKTFTAECVKLKDKGKWKELKDKTEKAIKSYSYGQLPSDSGTLYMLCGQANYELGFLIVAQNVLDRVLSFYDDGLKDLRETEVPQK